MPSDSGGQNGTARRTYHEDKYIQKKHSIQGIFRVFFYCRTTEAVLK